jgi:ubiquinone/menaquinone biosynthesis C-methylase UbiE
MQRDRGAAQEFFRSSVMEYETLHYGSGVRSLMSVRQERILEQVDSLTLATGSRVLDAGCGPGLLTSMLAERGFATWAVDTSEAMLERARSRVAGLEHRSSLASIERLCFPEASFDLVCSAGVIEYLPDDAPVLREFHRVLAPGGHVVLPVTHFWSPAGYLDFLVEALKRWEPFIRVFNRIWARGGQPPLRARPFRVRRHRPAAFRRALRDAGFEVVDEGFFYLLPWPHPLDRLFPRTTARLGAGLEPLSRGWLGPLAEGYLVVARKRPQ